MNKLRNLLIFLSLSSCTSVLREPAPVKYLYQTQLRPVLACYRMIITSQDPFTFIPDRLVDLSYCDGAIGISIEDQPAVAKWTKYAQTKVREKCGHKTTSAQE